MLMQLDMMPMSQANIAAGWVAWWQCERPVRDRALQISGEIARQPIAFRIAQRRAHAAEGGRVTELAGTLRGQRDEPGVTPDIDLRWHAGGAGQPNRVHAVPRMFGRRSLQKLIRNHRNDQSGADPNAIPLSKPSAIRLTASRQHGYLPLFPRMTCAARKIRGRPTLFTNRNVRIDILTLVLTSFNVPEQTKTKLT